MPCYHPVPAYQGGTGEDVRLWPPVGTANLEIPCGNCLGCRTDTAADWARRALHEASLWEHNCFLTLTYSEGNLPPDGDLQPRDLTLFLKRLRRAFDAKRQTRPRNIHRGRSLFLAGDTRHSLRYIAAGEYGDRNGRPHYHLLLFNCGFTDAYAVAKDLLESPVLQQLWPAGIHRLGALTGASANYVAQYTLKKQGTGTTYCTPDGVIRTSPFMRMSTKPAIGHDWLAKWKEDLKHGYLVTDGQPSRIPRSYAKKLCQLDNQLLSTAQARASRHPRRRDNLSAAEEIHARRNALASRRPL